MVLEKVPGLGILVLVKEEVCFGGLMGGKLSWQGKRTCRANDGASGVDAGEARS